MEIFSEQLQENVEVKFIDLSFLWIINFNIFNIIIEFNNSIRNRDNECNVNRISFLIRCTIESPRFSQRRQYFHLMNFCDQKER